MNNEKRKKSFFANKMHKDLFLLVFFAALIPMFLAVLSLYYLMFSVTAEQIGIPETIAMTLFPAANKVCIVLLIIMPLTVVGLLIGAFFITHKIVGPFDRILREVDESIKGERTTPIVLREKDRFQPLVDRINKLLQKK